MSPSWRERLLVGVSPSGLTLVRIKGLLRPRVVDKRVVSCDPAFGPEHWHGAAAALQDEAAQLRGGALDVTLVLSNHFVRYALVPWNEALAGESEELAFARHCFAKIHGERARSWTVSLSQEPAGAPRIASAIDAALLDAIRACFPSDDGTRLVSLQPCLMAAANFWYRPVAQEDAWILISESDRVCLALRSNGRWQSVLNAKGSYNTPEEWAGLLDRERLRTPSGEAVTKVLVHVAEGPITPWPQVGFWRLEALSAPALEGYSPVEDVRYTMALASGLS